jgi:hypothetical protein
MCFLLYRALFDYNNVQIKHFLICNSMLSYTDAYMYVYHTGAYGFYAQYYNML